MTCLVKRQRWANAQVPLWAEPHWDVLGMGQSSWVGTGILPHQSDTDGHLIATITGYRVSVDGTFLTAHHLVPEILDNCPIKTICVFFCKCWGYMDAYRCDYISFIHTFDLNFIQKRSKCKTGQVCREKNTNLIGVVGQPWWWVSVCCWTEEDAD